ncbi:Tar (HIV-1) RNA binding protein 1 [Desmophyllum pertusum]|uniref:tRNA (guanosine(18)-2'-O)-methyltransferase TARBP1 n=1 Tax=Desmophyllum pertusum TaxID=174260 RepID=A0A9X0A618_9CNID|nr:Tar (HIV-1) RNA binding protein 1 [Desmophyllum pertusum]
MRVTNYVLEYMRRLGEEGTICPLNVDELRDDTRVRVNALNILMTLYPGNARDARLLQRVVRTLITKHGEVTVDKRRSTINSYSHRRKHRVWQVILVTLSRLFQAAVDDEGLFAREVLEEILRAMLCENQLSVRNFLQWGMVLIFGKYPSMLSLLWEQLKYNRDRRAGGVSSLITVTPLIGEFSFPDSRSQAAFFQQAFPAILPGCRHTLRWRCRRCGSPANGKICMTSYQITPLSSPAFDFLQTNNDGFRQKSRLLGDFFFLDLHPYRDFSIQTLFETLPRLAEVTDEEWISPKLFTQGSLGMRIWGSSGKALVDYRCIIPISNAAADVINYDENIGEQISRRLAGDAINSGQGTVRTSDATNARMSGPQSRDVQKKIMPWKVIPPDEEMMSEMQQQRMANLKRAQPGNLIVVASLIDKAPNLGGLCRTCEIFGAQTLVLSNTHVIEDVQFKSLSVSAAKWMNIEEVRMYELKAYLASMRHEGYTLIGVEQTANSENLTRYQFPHKSLLLLGHEKEGIPVELIQMLDVCVEIPQVGVIRSLNVHVSGALLVWEYSRQRVLGGVL